MLSMKKMFCLLMLSGLGAVAHAADFVCVYTEPEFRGRSLCYYPNEASANLAGTIFQDSISSIEVVGYATAFVCTDAGWRGRCETITRSMRMVPVGMDNQISSISVSYRNGQPPRPPQPPPTNPPPPAGYGTACFYTESYFYGSPLCLYPGDQIPDLRRSYHNDNISSIDMRGYARAYVCRDPFFRGPCFTFDYPQYTLWMDNAISSLRVY